MKVWRGSLTRFSFKILSRVFNLDASEVAAPVHLFYVLEKQIEQEQFPAEKAEKYKEFLKGYLIPKYVEFIGKELQTAYLESYLNTGKISLTVTSLMQIFGFKIKSIVIQKQVNFSTEQR